MDINELIKQSGKSIDLKSIPEGMLDVVGLVAGAAVKQEREAIVASVKESIGESLKPFEERLGAVEKKGGGGGSGDPKPNDGEGKGDVDPREAKIAELEKTLLEMKSGYDGDKKRAQARAAAEAYLKTKLPNLREVDRPRLIEKIVAAGADSEDAIKKVADGYREELKQLGVPDIEKAFSADSKGEGAKENEADEAKAKARAALEEAKKQRVV